MKFKIKKEVFEKFPKMFVAIPIIKGFKNSGNEELVTETLSKAKQNLLSKYSKLEEFLEFPNIKAYFDCFITFGANPKKVKPTHFALAKRIIEGGDLPRINPIVDLYNAFSIQNILPFGGEDLSKVYGDFVLQFAKGDEHWLGIGERVAKHPKAGDLIWADDYDVSTISLDHRQCERTKATEKTTNGYFIMDGFAGVNDEQIKNVAKEFSEFIIANFGGEYEILYLNYENPEAEINYNSLSIEGIELPKVTALNSGGDGSENGRLGIRKRRAESMNLTDSRDLSVELSTIVSETLAQSGVEIDFKLQVSDRPEIADFTSTSAFQLAKDRGENPRGLAEQIIDTLKKQNDKLETIFKEISIAGPGFLNFKLNDNYLLKQLAQVSNDPKFTSSDVGNGKRILVESPGWNPNKTPHVGHLLNMFLGQTLKRLVSQVGFVALGDDIDNDKGIPVMQTIWAYMKYGGGATPDSTGKKSDHFVNEFYLRGKREYEESEEIQAEVREILQKWEAKDEEIRNIWNKLVTWGRDGQTAVFNLYGEIRDAHQWHESDVFEGGKEIVVAAEGKGVIERLEDGALIARIEKKYGLPDTIVLKRDGSGLYHTQDINLTLQKKAKFNPWKIIWVVAEEQIVHFQRLFAILDSLQIMAIDNLYHFPYGWVVGKDGKKLSSRDGVDLTADSLYTMAFEKAKAVIMTRQVGVDESKVKAEAEVDKIARAVAIGAIKFFLLSHDPFTTIKFDLDEAVSFTGKSGPYVMYSYTRAQNILDKVISKAPELSSVDLGEGLKVNELELQDRVMLIKLLQYPKVLVDSANYLYPGMLAEYIYDLAKSFSSYYENVKVSESTGDLLKLRVSLLKLYSRTIKAGLEVFGIDVLESM